MKILIRLPNWLGDVVMSTAFIASVRQLYPDSKIDVIIKKELAELTTFIPGLQVTHLFSKQEYKGLSGAYRFGKKLHAGNYDLFFNLPSSLSSLTLAWATGAKNRVGFKKEGGFFLLTNKFKKPLGLHRVDEYIFLLEQFTGKIIRDRKVFLNIDKTYLINKHRVLINFNSEAESGRMPIDKGRRLINLLTYSFPEITFTFIGSAKEAAFIDQLISGVDKNIRIENVAGKTDLRGLCDLMAGCAVVLTTDSGPAHLANSIGTPTVVLFGAGNEANTAPYNKKDLFVLRYGKLSCEPCVRNVCKLYGVPKCMELIDETGIIDAVSRFIGDS